MNATSNPQTSFKKKGAGILNIQGTRVSVQNAQLLTSTGSSTLDFFIGGGLAIGTLCLVEEDYYNTYSHLLLKYFLAEGLSSNHSIFLASGDKDPADILKTLPAPKSFEIENQEKKIEDSMSDDLKIAWRYKKKTATDANMQQSYHCGYDLSKTIPENILEKTHCVTWDPSNHFETLYEPCKFVDSPYSDLFEKIKFEIQAQFKTSDKSCSSVLRIGISSIGSPLWQSSASNKQWLNLLRFLYMLKSLLRTSFAVAFITLPLFLLKDNVLINRINRMADTVVSLESFVGSNKKSNPLFKDFDGLLHVMKLPVLNTYMYNSPTMDLAFKLKKKGFLIERLHLPPDFEESSSTEQNTLGCGGLVSKLDF